MRFIGTLLVFLLLFPVTGVAQDDIDSSEAEKAEQMPVITELMFEKIEYTPENLKKYPFIKNMSEYYAEKDPLTENMGEGERFFVAPQMHVALMDNDHLDTPLLFYQAASAEHCGSHGCALTIYKVRGEADFRRINDLIFPHRLYEAYCPEYLSLVVAQAEWRYTGEVFKFFRKHKNLSEIPPCEEKRNEVRPLLPPERVQEGEDPLERWLQKLHYRKYGNTPLPKIPERIKEVESPLGRWRLMQQWWEENTPVLEPKNNAMAAEMVSPSDDSNKSGATEPRYFIEIPKMVAYLSVEDDRTPVSLHVRAKIELKNKDDMAAIEAFMPEIVEDLRAFLNKLRPRDLRQAAGLYRLELHLLSIINAIIEPIEAKSLSFEEILMIKKEEAD